jgi:hypothetical protein
MLIMMQVIKNDHWKKINTVVIAVFAIVTARAQYNITAALPSGGLYLRSELWNISISNTSTASIEVVLQMEMKDLQTHQPVLSATSGNFILTPGIKAIQATSLEPIQYIGTNGLADRSPNSFLPVGQYQVCYQLFQVLHIDRLPVADDCAQLEVEPLSPPILTMPENDSMIAINNPLFTWVPPAPTGMFGDLNYDLMITEVFDGQSPLDAIQKNLPLQQAQNLQQPFFSFPLQGPQLEKDKIYAWQISAKDQLRFAASSEVWTFKTGDKKNITAINNAIYLLMDGNNTGIADLNGYTLHIKYVSFNSLHEVSVVFREENGKIVNTIKRAIKQGDNYLDLPLNRPFKNNTNYSVSIADNDNKTSSLSFIIK